MAKASIPQHLLRVKAWDRKDRALSEVYVLKMVNDRQPNPFAGVEYSTQKASIHGNNTSEKTTKARDTQPGVEISTFSRNQRCFQAEVRRSQPALLFCLLSTSKQAHSEPRKSAGASTMPLSELASCLPSQIVHWRIPAVPAVRL